ncbi:MAG: helix-turn-helix transcriptional regulator [Coriobacteriales bacterium]|nr:helix-turn-helix transcriptional regulator [Coriobacteriales bacterium]
MPDIIEELDLPRIVEITQTRPYSTIVEDSEGEAHMLNCVLLDLSVLITIGSMPELPPIEDVAPSFQDTQMYFIGNNGIKYAFTENDGLIDILTFEDFDLGDDSGIISVDHDNVSYRVYYHNLPSGAVTFLFATPDYAQQRMANLIIETSIVLVVLLITGTLSAFFLTRRLYRPVQQLIGKLVTGQRQPENNEFKLIDEAFRDVDDQLRAQSLLVRRYGLHRLLNGQSDEEFETEMSAFFHIPATMREIDSESKGRSLLCAMVRFDGYVDQKQTSLDLHHLEQTVEVALLSSETQVLSVQDSGYIFTVVSFETSRLTKIIEQFAQLQAGLEDEGRILISVFISRTVPTIDTLSVAYSDVLAIAEFVTLHERFNVIATYDALQVQIADSGLRSIVSLDEQRLLAAIRSLSADTLTLFDRCIERMTGDQNQSLTLLSVRFAALKNNVVLALYDSFALQRACSLDQRYTDMIIEAKSASQIRQRLEDILTELRHKESSQSLDDEFCESIVVFIQDRFTDPDLSASVVAREFNISQSGVTRVIKRARGEGFLKYLHSLRIAKAHELLLTTTLSIADISIQVGYTNALTMTRAFKRYTGTTPGSFRRL